MAPPETLRPATLFRNEALMQALGDPGSPSSVEASPARANSDARVYDVVRAAERTPCPMVLRPSRKDDDAAKLVEGGSSSL